MLSLKKILERRKYENPYFLHHVDYLFTQKIDLFHAKIRSIGPDVPETTCGVVGSQYLLIVEDIIPNKIKRFSNKQFLFIFSFFLLKYFISCHVVFIG